MVLFYVDDSGDERITTFSAIGVPVAGWNTATAQWLAWRRRLRNEHGVGVEYRLHATHWVTRRGRPARNARSVLNHSRPARWQAYVTALDTLASMPGLVVLDVARADNDRAAAYRLLMRRMEAFLAARAEHGMVILDGESPELRTLHGEGSGIAPACRGSMEARRARESVAPGCRPRGLCGIPAPCAPTRSCLHVALVRAPPGRRDRAGRRRAAPRRPFRNL